MSNRVGATAVPDEDVNMKTTRRLGTENAWKIDYGGGVVNVPVGSDGN